MRILLSVPLVAMLLGGFLYSGKVFETIQQFQQFVHQIGDVKHHKNRLKRSELRAATTCPPRVISTAISTKSARVSDVEFGPVFTFSTIESKTVIMITKSNVGAQ